MFDLKKLIEILTQYLNKQEEWKNREEALKIIMPIYLHHLTGNGAERALAQALKEFKPLEEAITNAVKSSKETTRN